MSSAPRSNCGNRNRVEVVLSDSQRSMRDKVIYNSDSKFDIQLQQSLIEQFDLGEMFESGKIELKGEDWQWEQTGNLAIEYECRGRPSGIATTEAEIWFHQLKRSGRTLMYFAIPVERLKELCRQAYRQGRYRVRAGDDGESKIILLPIWWLLRMN
jgi:hypothetical protein